MFIIYTYINIGVSVKTKYDKYMLWYIVKSEKGRTF